MEFGVLKSNVDLGTEGELAAVFAAPLSVISERVRFGGDSFALRRTASSSRAQRWNITAGFSSEPEYVVSSMINKVSNDVSSPVYVRFPQIVKSYGTSVGYSYLNGSFETFPGKPLFRRPSDIAFSRGEATLRASAGIGIDTVSLALNQGAELFSGDFLQFRNHDKVYMVQSISKSAGSNANEPHLDVKLFPRLFAPVVDGTGLRLGSDAVVPMYYDLDTILGVQFADGVMTELGAVKLVEAML